MRIKLVDNPEIVKMVRQAVKDNDGYCPCKIEKTPDTKCICREFLQSPVGKCQCGLYIKTQE